MKRGLAWYKRDPRAIIDAKRAAKMTCRQAAIYDLVVDLLYEGAGETPDDPKYLAGHFADIGPSAARRAIQDLVDMGKITRRGGMLVQKRAETEAKARENLSETRAKAGKKGGEKSAENRRKANEYSGPQAASATSKTQADKRREEKRDEEEDARARTSPSELSEARDIRDRLLPIIGVDPSKDVTGKWWGPSPVYDVQSWLELGLTEDDILGEAGAVTAGFTTPPHSLAFLTPAMKRLAGRKTAPKLQPVLPNPSAGGQYGRSHATDAARDEHEERMRRIRQAAIEGTTG